MQRPIAIAVVALLAAAMIPSTIASETVSTPYDVPSGPIRLNPETGCGTASCGPGITWNPLRCSDDDLIQEGDGLCAPIDGDHDGWVHVGVQVPASTCGDCYSSFLVSIIDLLPSSAFYTFCIITDHQDERGYGDTWCGEDPECRADPAACDDIADPRVQTCGSAQLTSPEVAAGGPTNSATAFVYASHVNEATGAVCLASKGTFTVSMS